MENMMIQQEGAIRVRPGMRYMSYLTPPTDAAPAGAAFLPAQVGTHEPFFLNDGSKAYLFACREGDGTVGFRVLAQTTAGQAVVSLAAAGFSVPQGETLLNFSANTRYVKYLQIDNKIFALSDAGEMMRLFYVGTSKVAKRLLSIDRPEWTVADKLLVVQPDIGWVNTGPPTTTRTNRFTNPSFETNTTGWTPNNALTKITRDASQHQDGAYSARLESLPTRTNLLPYALGDVATDGTVGWTPGAGSASVAVSAPLNALRWTLSPGPVGQRGYVNSPYAAVVAGQDYAVSWDLAELTNISRMTVMVRFYNSANTQLGAQAEFGGVALTLTRKTTINVRPPTGATKARFFFYGERGSATLGCAVSIKNVLVARETEPTTFFWGNSGTSYYWTGATKASPSVYHPSADIAVRATVTVGALAVAAGISMRGSVARQGGMDFTFNGASGVIATKTGTLVTLPTAAWATVTNSDIAHAGTTTVTVVVKVNTAARGETYFIDSALFEASPTIGAYFDGSSADVPAQTHDWSGTAHNSTSNERAYSVGNTIPPAETKTANTLISSTSTANVYNFGFFYTFMNEVGESAPSPITVMRTQRPWSGWRWETGNTAGEPSGTTTADPIACADQLVAYMPSDVLAAGLAAGAISWNLYMYTWSDQDPVPVTAVRVDARTLTPASVHGSSGWLRVTPSQSEAGSETMVPPTKTGRFNYSSPSRGGQGLVAADRMVLVADARDPAVIRWTSNLQGSYTDFSASRGGGFKTLTSGNLYIPACVKLWQNPQSADTLTILCRGVDGYSAGYYMAPAQVASQSEATNIMGFEETTATPGTTSPYGCEVFNNALYHPLDDQLMKSTANNYNISHKSQSDKIENKWKALTRKEWIVSSLHDSHIYYLVNNPDGEPLEDGCSGNEIWVFDGSGSADAPGGGSWSRWLVQACSLRKIEQGGQIYMSVIRPSGIYYFDELYGLDDFVDDAGLISSRPIPWKMETNTQGANRAHDAWCHLQQLQLSLGNFTGGLRYGIRSFDIHGKPIEYAKNVYDNNDRTEAMFDLEDFLQVRRDLKEWFFFAESTVGPDGVSTLASFGQINLVQYRYTPVSVNVGYEYGSVETFEYGRADYTGMRGLPDPLSVNGVPRPMIDTRRP
jgi:hypothetical protein